MRLGSLILNQKNLRSHIVTHTIEDDGDLHGAVSIYRVKKYFSIRTVRLLRHLLLQTEFKAVILHNPWVILLWVIFVEPFHRVRRITEIHNFRDESCLKSFMVGFLYRRVDAVVVLSNRAVSFVADRYSVKRQKICVVRNGVPDMPNPRQLSGRSEKIVFSYIGTFHDWQGVYVILQALQEIQTNFFVRAKVVFAGNGPLGEVVRNALFPFISRGQVEWHGWVDKARANEILAESDVVLIPRKSTLGTEYVLPLKIFEAMCYSKAILATDVGGLTEVLKHGKNAWIVPPDDPIALAQAMVYLAGKKDLIEKLGERGRIEVTNFETWRDCSAHYERIIGLETDKPNYILG